MSFDNPFWLAGCGLVLVGFVRAGALYVQLQRQRKQEERTPE